MTILVSPLSRVPEVIAERKPARVISLLDPTMAFPETGPAYIDKHLRVEVHDIVEAQEGWLHPTEAHIDELLKFIAAWDEKGPILIHCYAGISRSTATAFVTACLHNPDVDEMIIARELRGASPTATPNRRSSTYRAQPAESVLVGVSHAKRIFGVLSAATSLLPSEVPSSIHVESIGTISAPCLDASAVSR